MGSFATEMQHFSASVHPDVEAQVAGTPGVYSQVHMLASVDRHLRHTHRQNQHLHLHLNHLHLHLHLHQRLNQVARTRVIFSLALRGRHVVARRTRWSRRKAAGATSALVASTRAADGRDGPGRGLSSLLRNFPAGAQGRWQAKTRAKPHGDRGTVGVRPAPLEEVVEPHGEGSHGR